MTTATIGNTVSVHYNGTFEDGTEFDSSHTRGEPITFEVGSGQMIAGFDAAVHGMTVGEVKTVTLAPENAYGLRNEEAIQVVPADQFPEDMELVVGHTITGVGPNGQQFMAKILETSAENTTLDFNHPLAGMDLNFKIELVSIEDAA